jgi:hypothetical protein
MVMVYGVMGRAGIALSVPTATTTMTASIAHGMTVDNTIHLLSRVREDFREVGRGQVKARSMSGLLAIAVALAAAAPPCNAAGAGQVAGAEPVMPAMGAQPGGAPLKDQYGKSDSPALHRGRMVVLIQGKPSALRRMKAWELKLKHGTDAGGLGYDVLRAVDAREVKGKKTESEVDQRLQQNVPPDIPILIDWSGDLIRQYKLPAAEVTVTIIDPTGRSCGSTPGPVNDDSLARTVELLTRATRKGSCP